MAVAEPTTGSTWADHESYERSHPIIVPSELSNPHLLTRKTASHKGWEIALPLDSSRLTKFDWFDVSLVHADRQRVLRLIDALLKACEARGFDLKYDPNDRKHHGVSVHVEGEPVRLALIERGAVVTHLSLEAWGRYMRQRKIWKDRPRRRLETRLNDVMLGIRAVAHAHMSNDRWHEESARRHAEFTEERRELRARIAQEKRDVESLLAEAHDWQQARILRTYIDAVDAQPMKGKARKERAAWAAWARDQADRLDPFLPSPPSILDTPKSCYRDLGWEEYFDEDGNIQEA